MNTWEEWLRERALAPNLAYISEGLTDSADEIANLEVELAAVKAENERLRLQPKAWADNVALSGPDVPESDGRILHVIEYLLTVYKRFGNTAITCSLQWGASALHKRDVQKVRIEELEAERDALRLAVCFLYVWTQDRWRRDFEADNGLCENELDDDKVIQAVIDAARNADPS